MQCPTQILLNSVSSAESPTCHPLPLDKMTQQEELIEEILSKVYISSPTVKDLTRNSIESSIVGDSHSEEERAVQIKSDKYPIVLKHDNLMGRCLVAARDIEAGEIFLNDWPLLTAPNAEESGTTCLGCCVVVTDESRLQMCCRCGWKVCSQACSNIPQHADFECKIFAKENIKPDLPSPYSFIASADYIKILRCLLLNDESNVENMEKWKQILSLEAHMDLRRNIPKVKLMSGLVKRFILNLCKLTQYDEATIDFVLGVVDVNAFRHSFAPVPLKPTSPKSQQNGEPVRNATFLYPQASMAAHGCVRNTDWRTLTGGQLEMKASHKILQGQVICHAYVDLMLGTPERRRLLRNIFYFDCFCDRCSDPTELNTFLSALKCTNCKTGYLLAENPLQYKSNWVCNNKPECNETKSYQFEREIVQQILAEEQQVSEQIEASTNVGTIRNLMNILKSHKDITVHPNHYRIISIEYTLVRHLLQIQNPAKTIMLEIKRLVKKYMNLSAVFHPSSECE